MVDLFVNSLNNQKKEVQHSQTNDNLLMNRYRHHMRNIHLFVQKKYRQLFRRQRLPSFRFFISFPHLRLGDFCALDDSTCNDILIQIEQTKYK